MALRLLKAVLKALNDFFIVLKDLGQYGVIVLGVDDENVRFHEVSYHFRDRLLGNLIDEPLDIMLVVSGVDVFNRVATVFLRRRHKTLGCGRLHRAPCLRQCPEPGRVRPIEENEDLRGQVEVGDAFEHQLELGPLLFRPSVDATDFLGHLICWHRD